MRGAAKPTPDLSFGGDPSAAARHRGEGAVRYAPIDLAAIGAATGLAAARVDTADAYRAALRTALDRQGPTLLDVTVDPGGYAAVLEAIRGEPGTLRRLTSRDVTGNGAQIGSSRPWCHRTTVGVYPT